MFRAKVELKVEADRRVIKMHSGMGLPPSRRDRMPGFCRPLMRMFGSRSSTASSLTKAERVTKILAELIASDATWLMVFNRAIDQIITNNHKVRENPRGLSQLDSYKRGLVNSLTGNLQKFGLGRVAKVETLEEIFSETDETSENSTQDCSETMIQAEEKPCCAL